MSLASVSIVGNLVKDPELYQFDSGRLKASFFVAVNSFNKSTQKKEAEYFKIEVWDKLANLANQFLRKGNQVTVVGRLSMERWQDKEGTQRCTAVVSANQISLPPKPKLLKKESNGEDLIDQFEGKSVEPLNPESNLITASAS